MAAIAILRVLHVGAAALFLGNIVCTLVWKMLAERTRDPVQINAALRLAVQADSRITLPTAIIVTISGIMLMGMLGWHVLGESWLQISLVIWLLSAVLAVTYLVPSLKRLATLSEGFRHSSCVTTEYEKSALRWNWVSAALIVMPLIILALAVTHLTDRR